MTSQEQHELTLAIIQQHAIEKQALSERIADNFAGWLRGKVERAAAAYAQRFAQPQQTEGK